jgi:hypothetical protein
MTRVLRGAVTQVSSSPPYVLGHDEAGQTEFTRRLAGHRNRQHRVAHRTRAAQSLCHPLHTAATTGAANLLVALATKDLSGLYAFLTKTGTIRRQPGTITQRGQNQPTCTRLSP